MNAVTKNADAEEWRQVDGFSGFYEVSSRGRLRGELLKHAKLTATEVIDIRYRVERGELQSHIASIFGITQSSVSDVCGRRTWRHV